MGCLKKYLTRKLIFYIYKVVENSLDGRRIDAKKEGRESSYQCDDR
jgi:hypothetical protein